MAADSPSTSRFTSTHWGAYRPVVTDGRLAAMGPAPCDGDPSPIRSLDKHGKPGCAVSRNGNRPAGIAPRLMRTFLSDEKKAVLFQHGYDLAVEAVRAGSNSPDQATKGLAFGERFNWSTSNMSTQS